MKELAEVLFPWANVSIDEEFYEQNSEFGGGWEELRDRAADIDNDIAEPGVEIVDDYPYAERVGRLSCTDFGLN